MKIKWKGLIGRMNAEFPKLKVYVLALLAVISLVVLFRSCRSDDAAIQSHENKAQQYEDKALNSEGKADASRDRADTIETQRVEQAKRVTEAKQRTAAGKVSLQQKRKEYDEAQNGTTRIDRSGSLNDRERRILAKLDQLYPDFGSVRTRTFDFKD